MQHLSRTELEAVLDIGLITCRAFTTSYLTASVAFITEQGVADMFHVGADLMGTSRLEDTLHKGHIAIPFQHLIVCDGRFANLRIRREDIHPQTILRVTSDIAFYPTLVFHEVTPHQGIIAAVGGLVEELLAQ